MSEPTAPPLIQPTPQAAPIQPAAQAKPALSDDEKAAKAAAAADEARKIATGRFVRYTGPRTNRGTRATITVADWAKAGIPAESGHEWNLRNDHKIPESAFTEAQLKQLFDVDERFEMVDAAGKVVNR